MNEITIGAIIGVLLLGLFFTIYSLIRDFPRKDTNELEIEANAMEVGHTPVNPSCCHGNVSTGCCCNKHNGKDRKFKRAKHHSETNKQQ